MPKYVLKWRTRKGVERPVVEEANADDIRYGFGKDTKAEVIERALVSMRKDIEKHENYLAHMKVYEQWLEKLLAREDKATTR